MRRAFAASSLAALALFAARAALADEWKLDPATMGQHEPKVGDKDWTESQESQTGSMKVSLNGKQVQDKKEDAELSYRYVREVVALDGKVITEALYKIVKWKETHRDTGKVDTTLEGHTVRVKGKPTERAFSIEDDADNKVSNDAKRWIEAEIAKRLPPGSEDAEKSLADNDELLSVLPKESIGEGSEWKVDLTKAVKAFGLKGADLTSSSGTGKLTKVRVENGVHMGVIDVTLKLPVPAPNFIWIEGGIMEVHIVGDVSLEPAKRSQGSQTTEAKVAGKGEGNTAKGPIALEQKLATKKTTTSGPVEE